MSDLNKNQYEPLVKEDLSCWRCSHPTKNIPTLKVHLQEEWDKEARREKARLAKRKKTTTEVPESGPSTDGKDDGPQEQKG